MIATDTAAPGLRPRRSPLLAVTAVMTVAAITVAMLTQPAWGVAAAAAAVAVVAVVVARKHMRRTVEEWALARIDEWRSEIDAATAADEIAAGALDIACELGMARYAELVLFREGVGWRARFGGPGAPVRWEPLPEPLGLTDVHAEIAQGSEVIHIDAEDGDGAERRRRLELLGGAAPPAVIVPLHGSHARGTLMVAEPLDPRFAPGTVDRLLVLAAQVAGALDTSLVTEQVRNAAERRLRTATTDVLTGLPNRAVFVERVDAAARLASAALPMATLLVNLDRFREINATFGHHIGDLLLQQFAARLRDSLPVTATVARLGGDEFAVLLCELRDQQDARRMAEELLHDLSRPHTVEGAELQLEASVGVALAPHHAHDAVGLLQAADIAMETAKRARSGAEIYDPSRGTHDGAHLRLLADLRRAIDHDGLSMVYQPKADLRSHRVHGVEALLRWHDRTRGRVPPGEFIPIAERTGLIHPLTRWVLRTVIAQQRAWLDAGLELEVAVNLSARNLLDPNLPAEIAGMLEEQRVPARLLRLEITESSLIVDPGRAESILAELHRRGISLSVDDFGTGYSSLAHLLRLPVDEIKVDRSFVSGLVERHSEAAIVRATVDLGRSLSITVTAEGVEDGTTWARLAELGCDLGQGFWLARPMDAPTLERWLRDFDAAQLSDTPSPGAPTSA